MRNTDGAQHGVAPACAEPSRWCLSEARSLHTRLISDLERCAADRKQLGGRGWWTSGRCMQTAMLQLLELAESKRVLHYFFGQEASALFVAAAAMAPAAAQRATALRRRELEAPAARYEEMARVAVRSNLLRHYRLPGCGDPHFNYSMVGRVALLWRPTGPGRERPCLWCNMNAGKLFAILGMARVLRTTHVIECGRMGGLPLLHYSRFGLNVTSIELNPLPWVVEALQQLAPSVRLITGDCVALIPPLIAAYRQANPSARIGIVFDGPKGTGVVGQANVLAADAAWIAIDDQNTGKILKEARKGPTPEQRTGGTVPEWPFADLNSAHWRLLMPQEPIQDAMNAQEQALAHGEVRIDINRDRIDPYNHTGDASLMLMLGGRWGMGGDSRGWYGCCT